MLDFLLVSPYYDDESDIESYDSGAEITPEFEPILRFAVESMDLLLNFFFMSRIVKTLGEIWSNLEFLVFLFGELYWPNA